MVGVIGSLALDVVTGGEPRVGGGPWHAGRALRALGERAVLFGKCGEPERAAVQRRLVALGLPVSLTTGGETTRFAFSYDAEGARTMAVEALGEPWATDEPSPRLLRRVRWLQLAPLLRGDFPADAFERLARGRRVLLDGQGLVRRRQLGPLVLDDDFDHGLLRHVTVLKLAEEEARAVVGDGELGELAGLGVPEVVVTFGVRGSLVLARGRADRIPATRLDADPTGAGDAFAAAYLAARASGHAPVSAARRATAVVGALLGRGTGG